MWYNICIEILYTWRFLMKYKAIFFDRDGTLTYYV